MLWERVGLRGREWEVGRAWEREGGLGEKGKRIARDAPALALEGVVHVDDVGVADAAHDGALCFGAAQVLLDHHLLGSGCAR